MNQENKIEEKLGGEGERGGWGGGGNSIPAACGTTVVIVEQEFAEAGTERKSSARAVRAARRLVDRRKLKGEEKEKEKDRLSHNRFPRPLSLKRTFVIALPLILKGRLKGPADVECERV